MAKILVVEDEASIRRIIVDALQEAGHIVVESADGIEAQRRIGSESLDLVITDILMPERDGIEMLMNMRKDNVDVPVIVITGIPIDTELYLKVAQNLGARRTLAKPFKMAELLKLTADVLGQSNKAE